MPSEELEETYAPQFSPTTGAPAKPVQLAFGALFIKQRLGLADEETVEQIREIAYMQFFLDFAGYSSKAPFDPSMMVHFRKRFSEEDLNRINELIAERGKALVFEAVALRARNATGAIRRRWAGDSWIIELVSTGRRDGKPFHHIHFFITTLRTGPKALLRLVRQRWAIENQWHCARRQLGRRPPM